MVLRTHHSPLFPVLFDLLLVQLVNQMKAEGAEPSRSSLAGFSRLNSRPLLLLQGFKDHNSMQTLRMSISTEEMRTFLLEEAKDGWKRRESIDVQTPTYGTKREQTLSSLCSALHIVLIAFPTFQSAKNLMKI